MDFIYIDIALLVIFCAVLGGFLYKHKKKLKVESKIFLLYRTKIGLKFINWASKKFSKALHVLSYFSITFGVVAMLAAFWLLYRSIELILTMVSVPKVPPIMPLVPYLPQLFNLPLPPFYFTYWIVIIAIVAVVHEFAHGIFASLYKLKVKATGFGFLGPFLAAFVEPDEKALRRRRPRQQLAILSAGSFSNFTFGIIFLLLMQLFFAVCYQPAGVIGYLYGNQRINASSIETVGNYSIDNFLNMSDKQLENITELLEVKTEDNGTFYLRQELFDSFKLISKGSLTAIVYLDAPAVKANLSGALQKIGDYEINKIEDVHDAIINFKPGETTTIKTNQGEYEITFANNPTNDSLPYLGIGFPYIDQTTLTIFELSSPFFSPFTYAAPRFNPEILQLIQYLFWWLIIISFSIALINMLPLGILDGGRFIYVAALGLTKSKKIAEFVFKAAAFIVLLILLILTVVWFVRII